MGLLRFTEHAAPRAGRLLTVDTTTRRTAPALFFALMLAFAVCFWGLQYKLSLYHFSAARTAGPVAKLLSQKERPVSSKDVDSVRPASQRPQSSILLSTFLIAAIVVGSQLVPSRWTRSVTPSDDSRQQCRANSFCFSPRPPPAPLPAN
jgi:hypothetical protein